MTIQIRKASRKKAKLRIGISGTSGSGKTYSGILIAKGLLGGKLDKVTIIDTENKSADLYSDMGDYNVITLEAPYTPEKYIEAIKVAEQAGMELIMIDSATPEWDGKGGCLESNELIAQNKFKGNSWAAWSVTKPRHQKFIEAIVSSPAHIIVTTRSKPETIQTEDKKIKKVGMKDIQQDQFEYELTLFFNIDRDRHFATASKDRTGLFSEMDPFIIDDKTGTMLRDWSESGADVSAPEVIVNQAQIDEEEAKKKEKETLVKKDRIMKQLKAIGFAPTSAEDVAAVVKLKATLDLVPENYDEIIARLSVLVDEHKGIKTEAPKPAVSGAQTNQ